MLTATPLTDPHQYPSRQKQALECARTRSEMVFEQARRRRQEESQTAQKAQETGCLPCETEQVEMGRGGWGGMNADAGVPVLESRLIPFVKHSAF